MDLYGVEQLLRPQRLSDVDQWQSGYCWLAGGTWIFSELQPQIQTLVDLEPLNWSELNIHEHGVTIGATCVMERLLSAAFPSMWLGAGALQDAVRHLASFKVQNVATIAGNLCLALPASTFAPVMLLLNAEYEIFTLAGDSYTVAAADFQTGAKQTVLKPGDVLRRIHIPTDYLQWRVSYQRICEASAGIAIAIVVAARSATGEVRFAIGACVPKPVLIAGLIHPTQGELSSALDTAIPHSQYLNDEIASTDYRHHVTRVLMERSLHELS